MNSVTRDNEPLYNSRIVNNYIKLIKNQYSFVNVEELLNDAGIELYQVEDEGHWFSQDEINRFHEKLQNITGNKNIAREAGRFAAAPGTIGVMRQHILGMIGPEFAYDLIGNYASKFTRSSDFQTKKLGPNKVEIIVTPKSGVKESEYQCENRFGFWEAITTAFNYDLPEIEHPECIFKGGKSCRYIVSWKQSTSILWKRFRNLTGAALFCFCLIISFNFVPTWHISTSIFATCLSIFLAISLYVNHINNKELQSAVENLQESSNNSLELINRNYEHALLINEISQALSKELELHNILKNIVEILAKRLDYDRGLILLANSDKTRLVAKNGFGYKADELSGFMLGSGFHLDRKDSKGVFVVCFHEKKPFLVNDLDEIKGSITARSFDFAKKIGAKSFICCPIVYENESIGVLAVDNIKTKAPLLQSDINILMSIANQIGISLHNAKLIEARFRQFQSILQVLAATTDARDPITAGHSEKVTEYAVGICNELGLSYNYTEMIRVASLLHDYGKIGVDDAILKKPGRLTSEEYDHIKTHADKIKKHS